MKKLLTLSAVVMLLPIGPLWGQTAKLKPAAKGSSNYTDSTYGFSVSPPAFPNPAKQQVVTALFTAPADGGFSSNMNVMIQPVTTTRGQYKAESEKSFQATGLKANSVREVTVSGKDALRLDYEGTIQGRELHFLSLAIIDKDRVYLVTCTAKVDAFPAVEAEFKKALDSFTLKR